jgi:hypothetical protein
MAENLTFTLTGQDHLSRVLNGTADSADRLRLRLSGITADADGNLRDLQGRFLSADEAAARLADTAATSRNSMAAMSDAAGKLGEALKANLISLAPAAIPAAAGLAGSAAAVAAQFGAVALAAGAYALALGPQIGKISEASEAQKKYKDAVEKSGATSQEAVKAQAEYQRQLEALPPATREAAVAVGILKDNFEEWSDSLSGDVMGPFTKGVAVANELLPRTTGLVEGASTQFDRLITMVGGGISTPGFDRLTDKMTDFSERTMRRAVDELTVFLAKVDSGEFDGGGLEQFFDFARENGPIVWDTLENVGEALLHVLEAGSGVGVGMLEVINALSGIVSAVPPEAIATLLQLAIAIKAVRLAAVGADAARTAMAALGVQIGAMRVAAAAAPGALAGTTAAIGTLSRTAKLAMAGTGIGLLLITLDQLSASSRKPQPDVDKLATSLTELGKSGKVSGEALRFYGKDLADLGLAFQRVIDPEGIDQVQQSIVSFFGMDSTPVQQAKEDVTAFDEALASLVSNGNQELAAAALENTIAKLEEQGYSTDGLSEKLTNYNDALAAQRLEQELAAQSMGLFGEQAQQVQGELDAQKASADGLRQAIQALNDVNRQGLGGMIGFEAAIDAASKAAEENAGVLDMQGGKLTLNTEKQRAAAQSLNDLAAKTDEAASSARESGASWNEVNGIYERGRQQLIKNAMQMGLNRDEAKALADQILKTPDKTAKVKGDIEDLKDKLADAKERLRKAPAEKQTRIKGEISHLKAQIAAARARLRAIPDEEVVLRIRAVQTGVQSAVDRAKAAARRAAGNARGGRVRGYAGGGDVQAFPGGGYIEGPGSGTSDSILALFGSGAMARVSNTEYVVRASSVQQYGVPFLDAINEGRLRVGRAAAKPGLPAARSIVAATDPAGSRPQVTYNVYPRASVISVADLRLLQRQEEAQQRVGRPR